jgi:hypothetical protein
MPDTIQEQAGAALSRAGQRLAEAETGVRDAIAGLNQAIDAAHAAGIGPRYARAMVNSQARLGALGRAYLNREIRSWNDIYESGRRPVNQKDSELLDLHVRPRPQAPAFSQGSASSVPGTLARAGQELARAETGYDTAYARFTDASDFAQYARIPAGEAASLVTAISGPLAGISREFVTAEVDDWDTSINLDLASKFADGTEPPGFWAAAADARAAKGSGDYRTAAASWMLARGQLPSGHLMRDGLDSLISALHAASGTGQHVTRDGYIVHHSTEPPSPWSTGQLVEAVRTHAAGLADGKQALRKVLDGWSDGAIAAAFDAARDPDEAVARACLFATLERAAAQPAMTITKSTPELQVSDVVLDHGMRVRTEHWPDLEPGWSDDEPNLYGPCYQRYVPGKGILRVAGLGEADGGYSWYLGLGKPAELIWAPGGRFARPGDAMRDADRQLAERQPGIWEPLTPGEARLLYVKLAGAEGLDPAREDLFTQIRIQALDPGYDGPNPFVIQHEAALHGYDALLRRAWREGDTDFLREHQADLDAADPEDLKDYLTRPGEDSAPGADQPPHPSPDFPDDFASVPGRTAKPRRTTSSPSEPAPGKTL